MKGLKLQLIFSDDGLEDLQDKVNSFIPDKDVQFATQSEVTPSEEYPWFMSVGIWYKEESEGPIKPTPTPTSGTPVRKLKA